MDPFVVVVFVAVYVGMMLGRVPGLRIDRTGIALLGAITLLVGGRLDTAQAWAAIDASTLGLLIGLMVVSAQLRLGGFYAALTRRIASAPLRPGALMGALVFASGGLSALLANDVVCLAITPILVDACARRRLDPVPFVLALAAASNVGSAATLIGNPQNMLIGQALDLSFAGYLVHGVTPAIAGLALVWWWACRCSRGRFARELAVAPIADRPFDRWQTAKGVAAAVGLVAAFTTTQVPREVVALGVAGLLLLSRRLHSREMLGLVDWQLCLLFAGLFVVHAALARTGAAADAVQGLRDAGLDVARPAALFGITAVLSNLVSNVPAVMLLLPAAEHPMAGPVLALASTLAGNFVLVGSIANLIVVEQAALCGVAPADGRSWFAAHLRFGAPITVGTLAIAAAWLGLVG